MEPVTEASDEETDQNEILDTTSKTKTNSNPVTDPPVSATSTLRAEANCARDVLEAEAGTRLRLVDEKEAPPQGYDQLSSQERYLPITNIMRIMKLNLPKGAKISKGAKECVQECVSEFISFITSEYPLFNVLFRVMAAN
eukprot:TRINITY_DN1178_c0_g1_i6.p1 TRINITY_DN1178_c0_g1~~TRINITY_DN1178_c0_g1_i6.p1  ORF type:complete len:140 (-),score=23.57 TRINITY_DN1178_c0_g1_i6:642-1061(-)